jgi:hypothetical protein
VLLTYTGTNGTSAAVGDAVRLLRQLMMEPGGGSSGDGPARAAAIRARELLRNVTNAGVAIAGHPCGTPLQRVSVHRGVIFCRCVHSFASAYYRTVILATAPRILGSMMIWPVGLHAWPACQPC